jgi:LCP family protein required for cell wall assembly
VEDSGTREAVDGPRHAEEKPRRRWLMYALLALSVVLVIGMTVAVVAYRNLNGNLESVDAFEDIIQERPTTIEAVGDALDVLVIGDDSREGTDIGGDTPGLSDTTILFHVSADRSRAYAVSIPRDLIVDRPACRSKADPERTVPAVQDVMWNAAYAVGGVACTIAQFEQMTDIRVDHFAVLRFQSIVDIVDALDGVQICVPESVPDWDGSVLLPEGTYEADGETARLYVQIRKQLGDGSDVGRMKRQQRFLSSLMAKLTSTGTLTNPKRLYDFLDASTKAVVTDPSLAKLSSMVDLAMDVRGISMDKVQFLTMPIAPYAPDPNRLSIGEGADELWSQLRNDDPLSAEFTGGAVTGADRAVGHIGQALVRRSGDYALC